MRRRWFILLALTATVATVSAWLHRDSTTDAQLQVEIPAPARPVKCAPSRKNLLEQMRQGYQASDSLVLTGRVAFNCGSDVAQTVQLNSSFRRGAIKSFRHEQEDGVIFGCDGHELYGYRPSENVYFQIPASRMTTGLSTWPDPIPSSLEICNPSLKLALASDAAEELRVVHRKIELLPDTTLEGLAYRALRSRPRERTGSLRYSSTLLRISCDRPNRSSRQVQARSAHQATVLRWTIPRAR